MNIFSGLQRYKTIVKTIRLLLLLLLDARVRVYVLTRVLIIQMRTFERKAPFPLSFLPLCGRSLALARREKTIYIYIYTHIRGALKIRAPPANLPVVEPSRL